MTAFVLTGQGGHWKIMRTDDLRVIYEGVGLDDLLAAIRKCYAAGITDAK